MRQKWCRHLCLSWHFKPPSYWMIVSTGGAQWCCWASQPSLVHVSTCIKNAASLNHGIIHHCRLEHVSTLFTRPDMSESTSLKVSLRTSAHSLSIYSPLLRCTSSQLLVFCSSGLFSLHLSLHLPFLPPLCPSLLPPSLHLWETGVVFMSEQWSLGRAVTTAPTGGEAPPPSSLSLPASLASAGSCAPSFHSRIPSQVPPEDKHRLLSVNLIPNM